MPKIARKSKGATRSETESNKRHSSGTSSTRRPKVMRNRWEQYKHDLYGDGPKYEHLYLSDEKLDNLFRRLGIPESELAEQRRQYDATVNEKFERSGGSEGRGLCQGRKPQPDDDPAKDNVHIVHVPDTSHLAIRFWDGGLEDEGQFCLDIYDIDAEVPVNSSELGFSLEVASMPGTLSVLCAGKLKSWEARSGFTPDQILPGEERFSVIEGAYLALHRSNLDPFWFKVPARRRLPAGVRAASPISL